MLSVSAKALNPTTLLSCVAVQTLLYHRYAVLFVPEAAGLLAEYSKPILGDVPGQILGIFDDYAPPKLYDFALREFAGCCGLPTSDDANPPWGLVEAMTFRAMCESLLEKDVREICGIH